MPSTVLQSQPRLEELEDYSELKGLVPPEHLPAPEVSRCFVSRGTSGEINGYCFIQAIVVIEPIWVAPEKRGTGVGPRLFGAAVEALQKKADEAGEQLAFYCRAETDEVDGYMKRLGFQPAGRAYVMKLGGG